MVRDYLVAFRYYNPHFLILYMIYVFFRSEESAQYFFNSLSVILFFFIARLIFLVRIPSHKDSANELPGTTKITPLIKGFLSAIIIANTQLRLNPTTINRSTPLSLCTLCRIFLYVLIYYFEIRSGRLHIWRQYIWYQIILDISPPPLSLSSSLSMRINIGRRAKVITIHKPIYFHYHKKHSLRKDCATRLPYPKHLYQIKTTTKLFYLN